MSYSKRNGFKNYPYIRMKIVIPCINVGIQFFSKYTDWSKVDYCYVKQHITGIYKDRLDWSKVDYYILNDKFLIDHVKYIPFFDSKIYQSFTLRHFRLFKDYIDWSIIDYSNLSEGFIREFKDYIDWSKIAYDYVSEEFLREFKDYIDWALLDYYRLSKEFLREFKDYIDWDLLLRYGIYKKDILNNNNYIYPVIEQHNDVCGICRDQEGSMIQLPCNHVFHSECISSWIERSRSCPMCRHKL